LQLTQAQENFLRAAWQAALNADHVWPEMAACEAALESGYGLSQLAREDNNLFGMKQHLHPLYGTHVLPTRECLAGEWKTCSASWVKYPDWKSCFEDRMATLRRLAPKYPHYAAALAAPTGTGYIYEVSRTWSTDPERATKVLAIYDAISGDWSAI
jgi:flagellum-specific peptidoglycan hydrolase FlgJ